MMHVGIRRALTLMTMCGVLVATSVAPAAEPTTKAEPKAKGKSVVKDAAKKKAPGADPKLYQQTVSRAVQFLLSQQQADGSYSPQAGTGITALATLGLLRAGRTPTDPAVAKSLKYLADQVREDGSIRPEESRIPNYETCLAIQCLSEANTDHQYDKILKAAEGYVRKVQIGGGEQATDESNFEFGGSGYGTSGRPDLSNTAFLVDTLHDLGAGEDDEAIKRAIIFVSRCQNLESEHNTTQFAAKDQDGGFYYTVAAGGVSPANKEGDQAQALRSYGTMTYAGLKSLIFAGLSPDDIRVQSALKWLQKNYNLEQNPGMGDAGLYYYYHTFAKCLAALDAETFEDDKGVSHNWRKELCEELARRQSKQGSWVNENTKWFEGDPNLVTSYALLALTYCKPGK